MLAVVFAFDKFCYKCQTSKFDGFCYYKSLISKFVIKKKTKNLIADHLSRLEQENEYNEVEINEIFLDEQL